MKGASGGIALLWKDVIDLHIVYATNNYLFAMIMNDPENEPWLLTVVYGPTNPLLKPFFFGKNSLILD